MYDISAIDCANDRVEIEVLNLETMESIKIDEKKRDVYQLYLVLKQYFKENDDLYNRA